MKAGTISLQFFATDYTMRLASSFIQEYFN